MMRTAAAVFGLSLLAPLAGAGFGWALAAVRAGTDRPVLLPVAYAIALAPASASLGGVLGLVLRARPDQAALRRPAAWAGALVGVGLGTFFAVALRGWHLGASGLPSTGLVWQADELAMTAAVLLPVIGLAAAAGGHVSSRSPGPVGGMVVALLGGALGAAAAGPLLVLSRMVSTDLGLHPIGSALLLAVVLALVGWWRFRSPPT